jgi:hypothetical protein
MPGKPLMGTHNGHVYQLNRATLQKFSGTACWGTAAGLWDTIDQVLIREEINNLRVAADGGHDCIVVGHIWVPSNNLIKKNLANTKILVEIFNGNGRVWLNANNGMDLSAQGAYVWLNSRSPTDLMRATFMVGEMTISISSSRYSAKSYSGRPTLLRNHISGRGPMKPTSPILGFGPWARWVVVEALPFGSW